MATVRYFFQDTELQHPHGMPNKQFEAMFGQVRCRRYDSFSRMVGYVVGTREIRPVERTIEFKSNPSLHQCDARCMNARGKSCECSCGGKNHGAGNFHCAEAA